MKQQNSGKSRNAGNKFGIHTSRVLTEEQYLQLKAVKETLEQLYVRQVTSTAPFDYHEAVVGMQLGQGVQMTLEKVLLNREPVNSEVTNMVVFGYLAETFRRSIRAKLDKK